jgi:hypothetical protein
MTKAQEMLELARGLRARRIICDGGNGNVYDIADEECERAAEIIERLAAQADAPGGQPQSLSIEETRQRAEDAIRTFCRSLGAAAVQMSHGEERIYYAGISLKALSVAVAMAVSRPNHDCGSDDAN